MIQNVLRIVVTVGTALVGAAIVFAILDYLLMLITGDVHNEAAIATAAVFSIVAGAMLGLFVGERVAARKNVSRSPELPTIASQLHDAVVGCP